MNATRELEIWRTIPLLIAVCLISIPGQAKYGGGTTFSFADGHSERWTWRDKRTLSVAQADYTQWQQSGRNDSVSTQPGNEDLHRVQRGVFGRLGYIAQECPGGVCPIR